VTDVCLSTVSPVITILKFFKNNAINVRKGTAIDIPAEVKGLPLPTLRWMKDNVVFEKPENEEKMTMETEEVRTECLCTENMSTSTSQITNDRCHHWGVRMTP